MLASFSADPTPCSAALARLAALGFSEQGVRERLGLNDLCDFQMKARNIYRAERLAARDPLDLAIEFWVLQSTLAPAELDRLFTGPEQEALVAADLLERGAGGGRACASLYPVGRQLIFSDQGWPELTPAGKAAVPYDQVMYVGTDSRWLARATVRRPVAAALDLCTGSGIHALLAAAHARRVTAVDINARAVRCTAFNARAMGLGHLEALQGDLYQPVTGRFDLITANPPFVPAPAQEIGFRDGGPSGEDIQGRIIAGLPKHLAPGGIAQIVTEFGERAGESLEPRLRQWLGGAPMDIHVLRLRTTSATIYAIGHADGDDGPAILEAVGRWGANLGAQGYQQVVSVLLAFQWSQGEPCYRVEEAEAPRREAGAEVEAALANERLAKDPGLLERLLQGRFQRTGPVLVVQASALGAATPDSAHCRLAGLAMPVEQGLDALELALISGLDEPVVTAEVLVEAARHGVERAAVLTALVSLVRKGLVRPG